MNWILVTCNKQFEYVALKRYTSRRYLGINSTIELQLSIEKIVMVWSKALYKT